MDISSLYLSVHNALINYCPNYSATKHFGRDFSLVWHVYVCGICKNYKFSTTLYFVTHIDRVTPFQFPGVLPTDECFTEGQVEGDGLPGIGKVINQDEPLYR